MKDTKITNCNSLPDEVKINLNVLSALMLNRVGGHVDRADVVTIHQCSTAQRGVKLLKELVQPGGLGDTISHCVILSFSTGSGDGILTLGGSGDEVVTKKHSISRGGLARIWTTGSVSISVDNKISGCKWSQQKVEVKSASNVV
jgi:hypothetical protein